MYSVCLKNYQEINSGDDKNQSENLLPWLLQRTTLSKFPEAYGLFPRATFIINKEIRNVMPHIAVIIEVCHRGLQRWLKSVSVVLKEPKDESPDDSRKQRKGILFWLWDEAFLNCQPGQSKKGSRQQVHINLTVDVIIFSENQPATDTGCQEGMKLEGLSLDTGLQGTQALVGKNKVSQVSGMHVCGLNNCLELLL